MKLVRLSEVTLSLMYESLAISGPHSGEKDEGLG